MSQYPNEIDQPPLPKPWGGCHDSLTRLLPELFINILEQLRPLGSLTTYESSAARPKIQLDYIESRSAFTNLCRVSKSIRPYATRYLYHTILLKDQMELLYFFHTIANNRDLRLIIRSFAWAGVLSTDDANFESTTRRDKEIAFLASEY